MRKRKAEQGWALYGNVETCGWKGKISALNPTIRMSGLLDFSCFRNTCTLTGPPSPPPDYLLMSIKG
jgi:hypothetical protein